MKKLLLLSSICLLVTYVTQAQWQPDVRLTNEPSPSNTSLNNAWCIAASGDTLHVVWDDQRDGTFEIFYNRSTDAGLSWEANTQLTNSAYSYDPSVAVSGLVVHIVWQELRDGYYEIYYKRSTDGGVSWEPDTRLTTNTSDSWNPSVSVIGSVVHVVWEDERQGNSEIYYKSSTDGGVSWGTDTRLTNNAADSWNPTVSVSGSAVHVAWYDFRDGNWEIYYKRSANGGLSWDAEKRLTTNTAVSRYPSVASSGSNVYVVWHDDRNGTYESYYKSSADGGLNWGADTRLSNSSAGSFYPSIAVSGAVLQVVWFDQRDGNYEIYYKRSTDGGLSWETDTRLTDDPAYSFYPSVAVSGPVVHVVWQDFRDGNYEIYYKRDPTGVPLGVNESLNSEQSIQISPNPFSTEVTVTNRINEPCELILYDMNAGKLAQNSFMGKLTLSVSHLSKGIYFYEVRKGNEILKKGRIIKM
ncbi:MAG: T9SS type A sorting domain-containing protein [Bacteroidales bacterium]|nr:T9SS type A sorting domain-containing protein [Bacteroidales bacterium]